MANWFPRKERGLLSTFVISGYSLGSAVASAVTGCICNIQDLGWAGVFYIVGGFGIFHAILSCLVLHETPQEHPRISSKELIYLSDNEEKGGSNQNGYWSCLPFLMKAFGEYSTSSIANWLLMKNYITIDVLRRGCNMIGCIGFSAAVFGTYLSECNGSMSAVTAAVSMFFTGVATPGAMIACIDMAPRFAGSLSGLLNGAGCTMSFLVSILVGILTKNKILSEWHLVFFISIAVVLSSGVVFAVFGSAKVQPWNFVQKESSKDINMVEKNGISPQITNSYQDKDLMCQCSIKGTVNFREAVSPMESLVDREERWEILSRRSSLKLGWNKSKRTVTYMVLKDTTNDKHNLDPFYDEFRGSRSDTVNRWH
ncbi:inorganic phosphate cotransporter [Trichonephila clavipes]|nr:inorganic phosphate cotransporter [Trichonephila clavipes]